MTEEKRKENVDAQDASDVEDNSDTASSDTYDSHDPESEYYDPENGFRKQPIEEVRQKVEEMEQCYLDAQAEMKELTEMMEKYKSLKSKCNKLSAYRVYQGPWSVYMERMEQEFPNEKFEIHEENTLFNISQQFDELTNELLRESALQVTKDV